MKKTIKYGGLVAGVATAAVAMGATPVFATSQAYKTGVDNGCNYKTDNFDFDDLSEAEQVEVLTAEAAAYDAMATCKTKEAAELKTKIDAAAAKAELVEGATNASDGSLNYAALATNANTLVSAFGALTDVNLSTKIQALDSYAAEGGIKEGINNSTATDAEIVAFAKEHASQYEGLADLLAAYDKAVAASTIAADVTNMNAANAAATAATDAAEADRKAIADIVEAAEKDAKDAEKAEATAIEEAEDAVEAAKEAGADEELLAKLDAILEAAKAGKAHPDLADVVAEANKAKADAAAAATDADNDLSDAEDAYIAASGDNNYTKTDTNEEKLEYLKGLSDDAIEALDTDEITAAKLEELVGTPAYNKAVKAVKEANGTDEADLYDIAATIYDDTNAGQDAQDVAGYFLGYLDAAALTELVNADIEAQAEKDRTAAVANEVATYKNKIDALDQAVANSNEADEALSDIKTAAGETPADDPKGQEDPKGEDDPTETTYTYATLSDSETAYVSGNDLVLHFDAPFANFAYIEIDGVKIDSAMYTAENGSTKITLSSALLDTLKAGEHEVVAYYDNGKTASAKFTIASAEVKTPNTGVYTAGAASTVSSLSAVVSAIMAATLAGAAVVIRRRA